MLTREPIGPIIGGQTTVNISRTMKPDPAIAALPRAAFLLLVLALLPVTAGAGPDFMSPGLTPEGLYARLQSEQAPLVVDVRKPWEYKVGHVPGAINIPLEELEQRSAELDGEHGVLIYCINGTRTRQAEPILLDAGITGLYHLEGAFYAWIQSGLPVEKGLPGK